MTEGTFLERTSDPHTALRTALLERGPVLPAPAARVLCASAAELARGGGAELLRGLRESGLGVARLDRPLSSEEFLELGRVLGRAMPETDPAVQPQVEHGVILDLVTKHGHTGDVSLQPFATQHLTLHTESSGRPAAAQPRYIVLMCREPGDNSTAAQTVLVSMASVAARLPAEALAVLAGTRYRTPGVPFVVREAEGRRVFSFRDFQAQPLEWVHTSDEVAEGDVNEALRSLLAAMYAPDATGIHWAPGMLVVIDNTFWFHGRTAGAVTFGRAPRHLRRLRILAGE
jgi:alpha-ketoglutarate-dependent taurine dioxygenase